MSLTITKGKVLVQRYPVTIEDIINLEKLLSSVDWLNIDNESRGLFLERIKNTIKYLNHEERDLFYLLLKKFSNISTTMFDSKLRKLINSLSDLLVDVNNIFIVPIVDEKSYLNSDLKSGQYIACLLKTLIIESAIFSDKNVVFISSPDGLKNHKNRTNSLIIFCDDFVGTGKQFNKAIKFYDKYSINSDTCVLMTLAILRKGYDVIVKKGYRVFADMICEKGISSNNDILDKQNALEIMSKIEKELQVPQKFIFGYGKSEGIVAIRQRSPNNTFPLFWKDRNSVDKAIFQR